MNPSCLVNFPCISFFCLLNLHLDFYLTSIVQTLFFLLYYLWVQMILLLLLLESIISCPNIKLNSRGASPALIYAICSNCIGWSESWAPYYIVSNAICFLLLFTNNGKFRIFQSIIASKNLTSHHNALCKVHYFDFL